MPSLPDQSTPSPSPLVGYNSSTPIPNFTPSSHTNISKTHSTSVTNDSEEEVPSVSDRPMIRPTGGG